MKNTQAFHNIKILDVINVQRDKTSLYTAKRNTNVLSIRTEGGAEFNCRNKSYSVGQNGILFISENAEYSQATAGETIIAIHFDGELELGEMSFFQTQNKRIFEYFKIISGLWRTETKTNLYKIYSNFYYILSEIQAMYDCPAAENKISKGYSHIIANFAEPDLKIGDVAQNLGISSSYFRREFKKLYGASPKEKLIELRLENAAALLKNKYCNISEAALQSGFNNASYLSTLFKKKYGISPSVWEKYN